MPVENTQYITPIKSNCEDWLTRTVEQYRMMQESKRLFFEDNWMGDNRPQDIKQYWASLTDTERAIQKLERTDAALYIEFYERINSSVPTWPIEP